MAFTVRQAEELYHLPGWSEGFFRINGKGHLTVRPDGARGPEADLVDVLDSLGDHDTSLPVVVRFPQILRHRVDRINQAFRSALSDEGLSVRYRGVFPVKVNQRKEVVQELARAGRRWQYGLEVGSKAELIAALTMDPNRKSLLVVNGFKDKPFLEAACHATAFKDEVVIVIDEVGEIPHLVRLLADVENKPLLGIRLKLRSKAPGKWASSGGQQAKFGLTVPELLWAVKQLRKAGLLDRLQLVHFHIGSQLAHIRRIAAGVREAGRLYTELVKTGVPLRLVDVGGGLAIDYDGSASSGPNSCNYTIEEYASTVVATLRESCEEAEVAMPDIISESGRAAVAHHAILVTDVRRRIPGRHFEADVTRHADDPTPLANLIDIHETLRPKDVFEAFHDVVQIRDDLYALFDLGHLDIERLGRAERLLHATLRQIKKTLESEGEADSEEYAQLRALLGQKLVANFSVFQSLPDAWGVKQQFPILPVQRLRERPTELATLADITCDSDGEIRRFIDSSGTRPELPVHSLQEGKPYHLAVCLVGAYQDSLGDYHNLFGETDEVFVEVDDEGWQITRSAHGSPVAEMLRWVRYEPGDLRQRLRRRIRRLQDSGRIDADEARRLREHFLHLMSGPTYLEAP